MKRIGRTKLKFMLLLRPFGLFSDEIGFRYPELIRRACSESDLNPVMRTDMLGVKEKMPRRRALERIMEMPSRLDIYGLTKRREENVIQRFLDRYIDRQKCEDRGDEELMILPLGAEISPNKLEDYDWEPAKTLTESISRGLAYPRRCFAVYLSSKNKRIHQVILKFTADDKLVLGLSIDDEGAKEDNLELAKQLLNELFRDYKCFKGLIVVEQHPPDTEKGVDILAKQQFCIFSKMGNDTD